METGNKIQVFNRNGHFWKGLLKAQKIIMFLTSILVVGLISYGAALRYLFKADFFGLEDIILVVSFWMYFIGGAYASYDKSHISAEVIPTYIKNKRTRSIVVLLASLITTILSWLLTYWGFLLTLWGIEMFAKTPALGIPYVIPQGAIFIGLALMSFYFTVYLIEDFRSFKMIGEISAPE